MLFITLTMALLCSNVQVGHVSVTVKQHAHYQDLETEAAEWNASINNFIIHTPAFPNVMCVCFEKGLSSQLLL